MYISVNSRNKNYDKNKDEMTLGRSHDSYLNHKAYSEGEFLSNYESKSQNILNYLSENSNFNHKTSSKQNIEEILLKKGDKAFSFQYDLVGSSEFWKNLNEALNFLTHTKDSKIDNQNKNYSLFENKDSYSKTKDYSLSKSFEEKITYSKHTINDLILDYLSKEFECSVTKEDDLLFFTRNKVHVVKSSYLLENPLETAYDLHKNLK